MIKDEVLKEYYRQADHSDEKLIDLTLNKVKQEITRRIEHEENNKLGPFIPDEIRQGIMAGLEDLLTFLDKEKEMKS